jgi:FtsP/CotA-like multicopper oxidase with cupredoxin domain
MLFNSHPVRCTKEESMVQGFDSSDMNDVFPQDVDGLPDALPPALVDLDDGDLLEMRIGPVRNSIGSDEVRMLAYNGSIPGPAFKVKQGTTVSVKVTNDAGLPKLCTGMAFG